MFNNLSESEKVSAQTDFYKYLIPKRALEVKKINTLVVRGYVALVALYVFGYISYFGVESALANIFDLKSILAVVFVYFFLKICSKLDEYDVSDIINSDIEYEFDTIKDLLNGYLVKGEIVYSTSNFYLCKHLLSVRSNGIHHNTTKYFISTLYSDEDIVDMINSFLESGKCRISKKHRINSITNYKSKELLEFADKDDEYAFDSSCRSYLS